MLVSFVECDIKSAWDGYTYLAVGDDVNALHHEERPCTSWIQFINSNGYFNTLHQNFTSKSSSITVIFSSFVTKANFTMRITAIKSQGNISKQCKKCSFSALSCNIVCISFIFIGNSFKRLSLCGLCFVFWYVFMHWVILSRIILNLIAIIFYFQLTNINWMHDNEIKEPIQIFTSRSLAIVYFFSSSVIMNSSPVSKFYGMREHLVLINQS